MVSYRILWEIYKGVVPSAFDRFRAAGPRLLKEAGAVNVRSRLHEDDARSAGSAQDCERSACSYPYAQGSRCSIVLCTTKPSMRIRYLSAVC